MILLCLVLQEAFGFLSIIALVITLLRKTKVSWTIFLSNGTIYSLINQKDQSFDYDIESLRGFYQQYFP